MPEISTATATAEVVALAIRAALAPLQAQIATLTEKCLQLQGEIENVGRLRERVAVIEAIPPVAGPAGAPGVDGFTPDEITLAQDPDDARVVTLGYRRGELSKSIGSVRFPLPAYCGVYDRERAYLPGDQVTHGGALWHCHAPTRAKPGDDGDGWQLQVKRGQG